MSLFPDWKHYAVSQRNRLTGCIPTGYEILLRAAHARGIDFNTFQEDFDVESKRLGENNFKTVAEAIQIRYPQASIEVAVFSSGAEKLRFLEEQLSQKRPVIVSIALGPSGGWHIMPVVDADSDTLRLLWETLPRGQGYMIWEFWKT